MTIQEQYDSLAKKTGDYYFQVRYHTQMLENLRKALSECEQERDRLSQQKALVDSGENT